MLDRSKKGATIHIADIELFEVVKAVAKYREVTISKLTQEALTFLLAANRDAFSMNKNDNKIHNPKMRRFVDSLHAPDYIVEGALRNVPEIVQQTEEAQLAKEAIATNDNYHKKVRKFYQKRAHELKKLMQTKKEITADDAVRSVYEKAQAIETKESALNGKITTTIVKDIS